MGAKELLQCIIGARHIGEAITEKQPRPVAAGDLTEVGQHGGESRSATVLVACHSAEESAEVLFDAIPVEAFGIGQHLGHTLDPDISGSHCGPKGGSVISALVDEAVEPLERLGQGPLFSTRARLWLMASRRS